MKLLHYASSLTYNISMKNIRKVITILLAILGTGCLVAGGFFVVRQMISDRQSEAVFDNLRTSAEDYLDSSQNPDSDTESSTEPSAVNSSTENSAEASGTTDESGESSSSALPSEEEDAPLPELIENPYQDSFLANEDMAAWLHIPDTNIDYPVMWTPRDENYYLYRDFERNDNKNGCLILDTDSCLDPLSTNLIIHGHNMRSGAMFGNLTDYEDFSFYEKHKQITLYTEAFERNYEVIAVFRSQVYKKSDDVFKFYKFFQADTQEEFDDFYNNIKQMSLYDTGVTAELGDHFITLSTCVYHVEQGRFVVIAKETDSTAAYLPFRD